MTSAQLAGHGRRLLISADRVWLVFAGVFLILALTVPGQVPLSLRFVLTNLMNIAPFLLLAILASAYAAATGSDNLIARAFSGRLVFTIVLAALMGALSPFCSCGVVPIIAALLGMGVPLAPVMAFWLSSPLMDPSMFIITAGQLGTEFAIAKTLFATLVGLLGGFGLYALQGSRLLEQPLREGIGGGGCGTGKIHDPKPAVWKFWHDPKRVATFWRDGQKTFFFLLKGLSIAYLLESLLLAWTPLERVIELVGDGGLVSILLAASLGAPAYLNGFAAVPLVSGLMDSGMAPGTAMAFLIGGGITSVPAAMAVYALVRKPLFGLYILFAFIGASLSGVLFQAWSGMVG